jgi:RNA polymerase sigma factor (sigma-70 family)
MNVRRALCHSFIRCSFISQRRKFEGIEFCNQQHRFGYGIFTMISDSDLILRVQKGERELFGELHARHHERIFRFIAHSIWQREAAQDVAGEVWLKAYKNVDAFQVRENSGVLAWLLCIASNCVTDYRRRLKPQASLDEEEESTLRLVAPSAEGEALRREKIEVVRSALSTLSEGDRQIIYLAHQDDLSCVQIATALNKPSVSAATSHLHRAMKHLRAALERSAWFDEAQEASTLPQLQSRKIGNARR